MKSARKPVRHPKQERSKVTVAVILDAAARILASGGYDNLQTNHVATLAGVGIGSLYEYFSDKDALVMALLERLAATIEQKLEDEFSTLEGVGLQQALGQLLRAVILVYEAAPNLHRELLNQAPSAVINNPLSRIEKGIREKFAALLRSCPDRITAAHIDAAAAVAVRSGRHLIEQSVADPLVMLNLSSVEAELYTLLHRYLTSDAHPE